jgi:hypothetical protein
MGQFIAIIESHWLAIALIVIGVAFAQWQWRRYRRKVVGILWPLTATAVILFGIGGVLIPVEAGMWAAAGFAAILFLAVLVVLLSSSWSYYVGLMLGAGLALSLGGWCIKPLTSLLAEGYRISRSVESGVSGNNTLWFFVPAILTLVLLIVGIVRWTLKPASGEKSRAGYYWAGALAIAGIVSIGCYVGIALKFEKRLGWFSVSMLATSICALVVWMSFRSLAALGPVRRVIAIGLRCLLVVLAILALAELRLRKQSESLTVLFLVDRSLSVPSDLEIRGGLAFDKRRDRVKSFIANSVHNRGSGRELDQSGVIVFGRRPRLVLPPSTTDKLELREELAQNVDPYYTDIAASIKLALASFPEGTSKRIILVSDGNENLGNVEEQARLAKLNNVQIDVVALAAGERNESEVLVQAVEAPPLTEQGSRLPIRVLLRSFNPQIVRGELRLRQESTDTSVLVPIVPGAGVESVQGMTAIVQLRPGLNSFSFRQTLGNDKQSYTYKAEFNPLGVVDENGQFTKGLANDRVQNNTATTHVVTLGQRRVLFIEGEGAQGQHKHLIDLLSQPGKSKFQIFPVTASKLPATKGELGLFLSNFDCVVMGNVPAEQFTNEQMEMLRANTFDQGCGLVMIGGPDSFGAGAWQDTPVEKALPVDCDIKSLEVAGKGGLVLIFHASEIAEGVRWQKEIAKLAVKKLSPVDKVGVIYWDFRTRWHVPFQTVGGNRGSILGLIDKMTPNDMPDCNPSLEMAYDELIKPSHALAIKHVIFISDGDHWNADAPLLAKYKAAGITCTTVCITSHGAAEEEKMKRMALDTGGRYYNSKTRPSTKDPKNLPQIYIQESRIVSQAFIHDKPFVPKSSPTGGPSSGLSTQLPSLGGFIRTTKKPSGLSSMPIQGPSTGDQEFPVLAYWYYGLGKAVAFTSEARTREQGKPGWDLEWKNSEFYLRFWEQLIGWALRSVETGRLAMVTEYRDGKIKVTVDARDENKKPLTNLRLEGAVTPPSPDSTGGKPIILDFKQKNAGQYEAEIKAEEAGSYFLNANAKEVVTEIVDGKPVQVEKTIDGIRSGLTIPYSPEFADLESNIGLLRKLAEMTGGQYWTETPEQLKEAIDSGALFRPTPINARSLQPAWFWLALALGITLFFDVALRRIAIEPAEIGAALITTWDRIRGRRVSGEKTPEFLARLRSRKAEVGETMEKGKAARRFEGELPEGAAPPPGADAAAPPPVRTPHRPAKPTTESAGDDYAARLMRAKRKAMGEGEDPKKT